MNELGIRTRMEASGSGVLSYRDEWTVDGGTLTRLVGRVSLAEGQGGLAAPLVDPSPFLPATASEYLDALLGGGAPDDVGLFADGRVPLLVCPVCADLGCGAVSARLVIGQGVVEWRDLGWQIPRDRADDEVEDVPFTPPLHLVFARDAYEALVARLLLRYRQA
ncbi:hypothetical protein [Oerskovia paurometabola]|uniref:hypothetical protein n=1 Tax=Oerskovia paurometabola TaxID=162170 RepID=UPI00341AA60A